MSLMVERAFYDKGLTINVKVFWCKVVRCPDDTLFFINWIKLFATLALS